MLFCVIFLKSHDKYLHKKKKKMLYSFYKVNGAVD